MFRQSNRANSLLALQAKAESERRKRTNVRVSTSDTADLYVNKDVVAWIEKYFYIPETPDHKIILGDYQKAMLREALSKDDQGLFVYSTVVWGDIKKSIKSCIAAAVGLYLSYTREWASARVVANDLKQADSRVFFYMRRALELNPSLTYKRRGYSIELDNHSQIEAVPVDPKGEAGGGDDIVIFSELWGANTSASQAMWTESTLSPTKFGKSLRWVETYAGYIGSAPILEMLYAQGHDQGVLIDEVSTQVSPPLQAYKNAPARILLMWNQTPRMPWQTPGYYAQEEGILLPKEFLRVHRNQWVTSQQAYIQPEWWAACYDVNIPALNNTIPVVIALDAAVSGDCFGVLMVSGRRGVSGFTGGEHCDVRYARKYVPPKGGKLDYQPIEEEIDRLCAANNVVEIVYDEYQLHDFAMRLRRKNKVHVRDFGQGAERTVSDKELRDKIMDKKIHYGGQLDDLTEHIYNADAKISKEDNQLRIVKRTEDKKIDLAVCLSMANSRITHWKL